MTTLAHILSSSYIGIVSAKVAPNETGFVIASLISAGAVDVDHVYFLIKNHKYFRKNGYKNNLHKARSMFHELVGFTIISTTALLLSFVDMKIAFVVSVPAMIHLVEDMIVGISIPFNPIDKTEINLIPQKTILKIMIDVLTIIIFGFLWINYLCALN
jgi:hypothetical protein